MFFELQQKKFLLSNIDFVGRSSHNYRGITRILVSLGELGFERYQAPLVEKLLEEAVIYKTLPNTLRSAMKYWIDAIKDDQERQKMWRRYYELMTPAIPTTRGGDLGMTPAAPTVGGSDPGMTPATTTTRGSDLGMTPATPTVRGSDPESRCAPGLIDGLKDSCNVVGSAACSPNGLAYTDTVRRDGDGASEHRASANGRAMHTHHDDSEHHLELNKLMDSCQEAFI